MRELKFDGLSPDGTTLVLVGKDGQKWSLVIDERIEAAVRRDRARIGQVEIEQSGVLRPREIQARIRAGATAEDVAAASGLPLEHIRRFEGPVLTERAWVAEQAQATEVRRPGGDIALGDLVAERLDAEGVDPDDVTWDAWRRDDGTWIVIATFPIPPNSHVATWTYDSGNRTMTVLDDNARSLSVIDPETPLTLSAVRPVLATVAPLADEDDEDDDEAEHTPVATIPAWSQDDAADEAESSSIEEGGPGQESTADDTAGDRREDGTPDQEPTSAGEPGPDETADETADEGDREAGPDPAGAQDDSGLFPTPSTVHKQSRKPSVPSFDDILFGPGPGAST